MREFRLFLQAASLPISPFRTGSRTCIQSSRMTGGFLEGRCPWPLLIPHFLFSALSIHGSWGGGGFEASPSPNQYGSAPLPLPFSPQCPFLMSTLQNYRWSSRIGQRGRKPGQGCSASYLWHLSFPICKVGRLRILSLASSQ